MSEKNERLLTNEEIGNALQPVEEDEYKDYYTSDGEIISCIDCDPVAVAQDSKTRAETLQQVIQIVDKFIGNGKYRVEIEAWGVVRCSSADVEYVWRKLRQELESLQSGQMPEDK